MKSIVLFILNHNYICLNVMGKCIISCVIISWLTVGKGRVISPKITENKR